MHFLQTFLPALLLAAGASAVPVENNHGTPATLQSKIESNWNSYNTSHGGLSTRSAKFEDIMEENVRLSEEAKRLGKRCTWNDGVGDIDCGYFSIIFGLEGPGNWGTRQNFFIRANNFEEFYTHGCDNNGDSWESFNSPLPWTVDVHPGNACLTLLADNKAWWDNLWIKYAAHFLNAPTDTRCGSVYQGGYGRRCIIAK